MLTKEMRDIEITIRNLGREAHNTGFIDERILERERQKWNNLIIETKQKLLWGGNNGNYKFMGNSSEIR